MREGRARAIPKRASGEVTKIHLEEFMQYFLMEFLKGFLEEFLGDFGKKFMGKILRKLLRTVVNDFQGILGEIIIKKNLGKISMEHIDE